MTEWGSRVRQRREALGMSKAALARACHVSGATISDWESGEIKTIYGENLLRAADALGCSPWWIATGSERQTDAAKYSPPPAPSNRHLIRDSSAAGVCSIEERRFLDNWEKLNSEAKKAIEILLKQLS